MQSSDKFITRASSIIILVTSLAIIAFMSYGGCGGGSNDGGSGPSSSPAPTATFTPPTPTPTTPPGATGSPGCGSVQVSIACPAVSLEEPNCIGHVCKVIDETGSEPVLIDEFTIGFSVKCTAFDCFTLECENTSEIIGDSTIVIESVSGIPVNEDSEEIEYNGKPDGTIFFDDTDYTFRCSDGGMVVP